MIVQEAARAFLGDTGQELSILRDGGSEVIFDAGSAPHVTASLSVHADAALAALLDPRDGARVRIQAGGKSFNLGLRSRPVAHGRGAVTLSLASDEAILKDWAPLTDDLAAYDLSSSVSAIVNYVLGVVLGASLHPSSSSGSTTPIYDVTNLILNPNAATTANWSATGGNLAGNGGLGFGNVAGYNMVTLSGSSAQVRPVATATAIDAFAVTPGGWYTANTYVRTAANGMTARQRVRWLDERGNAVGDSAGEARAVTGTMQRVGITAQAPYNAVKAFPYVDAAGASGNVLHVDAAMFHAGRFAVNYYDGNTSNTTTYTYSWTGNTNGSTSTRAALIDGADPDSLVWQSGQSALDFLAPIVQTAGLRLVCDEARVWTLRPETYRAPGALTIRSGINLIDGTDTIDRDGDLWFDAAVTVYKWTAGGVQRERRDTFALQQPYRRVRTFERNTPYPGPGFSQYAVRRAQGRGREVDATKLADYSVRAEQAVEVTFRDTPVQIGITQTVRFDLDRNEMTVTARTTDTPAGSIDLLNGTINALTGPIDSL